MQWLQCCKTAGWLVIKTYEITSEWESLSSSPMWAKVIKTKHPSTCTNNHNTAPATSQDLRTNKYSEAQVKVISNI